MNDSNALSGLRVAFLNGSKAWGGGEKWHFNTALRLQPECDAVFFVSHPDGIPAQRIAETAVTFQPLIVRNASFTNLLKQLRFSQWLRTERIDTLLINSPAEVRFAAPAAKWAGVSNVVFRRGMPHPIKANLVNRWVFGYCVDRVIANSQEIARSLNGAHPNMVAAEKIAVIYNGIDLDEFAGIASRPLYRDQDPRTVLLGTAGRMVKQKNQHRLIEVAAELKQRGCNFKLLLAGTGELESELTQLVQSLGVEQQIEFLGFVGNIKDLLEHIDVFVFSSLYEGSANALIEACAAGLPSVAFDVSSNPEIVKHDHNGLLAPLDDVSGFADCCQRLIEDTELRRSFGDRAKQDVRENFNQQLIWSQIQSVVVPK